MVFILVSSVIVVLIVLRSLILTTRMVIGEFQCQKPSDNFHPEQHDVRHYHFDRLSDILLIPTGFLHMPEHIYLMVFLYKFIGVYINWEPDYKKELWPEMKEFVCNKKKIPHLLLYGVILVMMLSVALLLPPMCIARVYVQRNITEEYCSKKLVFVQRSLSHAFHGVSFFTNGAVALTRWLMVFFTIMVGVMWRRVKPSLDHQQRRSTFSKVITKNATESEDWKAVCCRHTDYIIEYMAIKEKVFPIYKIFRSFFVLQWIIHLFGLFCHIAHLVRPWIRNGQVLDANMLIVTHQIYQLLYVLYNGLALVITYICALKMNAYLRRYVRKLQQKQLDEAKDKSTMQYSLTHLFLIKVESVSKSSFVPRIPGTGLSVSVESPGFVLSVVLSVFALIGALISF